MDNMPSETGWGRDLGDQELIALVRAGDQDAFALLYRRHRQTALRIARYCSRRDAEDLCAEAFTSALRAIKNGRGPSGPLQPYLSAVIRHTAATWSRRDLAVLLVGEPANLPDSASETESALSRMERALAAQAFNSLPERWRDVLKHTLIDARSPRSVAEMLQIAPSAASSLAYRAREGLREAYLQAHAKSVTSPACRPFAQRLAAFARGRLGPRRDAAERAHLAVCRDCSRAFDAIREIDCQLMHRGVVKSQRPGRV